MTNYAALGEFTAYSRQAKDAASRRFALLHNLSNTLRRQSEDPLIPFAEDKLQADVAEIASADAEMRAALERANQAAALCGERPLALSKLHAWE